MQKLFKSYGQIKSDDAGAISGYFSTYDKIPDSYGDIVEPGAFTDTLKARAESGHPFPLCWNHDLDQIIGSVDPADIQDDDRGPFMAKAAFFDTPLAQEKRALVKSGVVYQFSFAYAVTASRTPTEEEKKAGIQNVLTGIDLFEISVVPVPANPRAEVTDVKAGRRNSKKDLDIMDEIEGHLKEALTGLRKLRETVDDTPTEDEEDKPEEDRRAANAKAEEPGADNSRRDALLNRIEKLMEV